MNPLSPVRNVPRWLAINMSHVRGWRGLLPPRNGRSTVLQVGVEPGHAYYETLRRGVEAAGWNVIWLPRTWEQKISHRLLLYFLLCPRADAVHLVDISLMTLFGEHSRLRISMGRAAIRAMVNWARLLGKRTIYSFGDWVPHEIQTGAEELRHRLICSLVQDLTSAGPSMTQALVESGVDAGRVWPLEHPDISDASRVPPGLPGCRESLGIPRDAIVLLHIGNIGYYKGLDIAIEAVKRAADARLRLVVAGCPTGSFPLERVLESAAGDPRIVLGPLRKLSYGEMGWLFGAANFCILPYRSIGQSGIVAQALGLGVPVIASRVGTLPDYVEPGTGLLFAPGDIDGLAQLLDSLSAFDRQKASERGLAMMRRRPAERIGQRLVRLYEYRRGGPQPEGEWLF